MCDQKSGPSPQSGRSKFQEGSACAGGGGGNGRVRGSGSRHPRAHGTAARSSLGEGGCRARPIVARRSRGRRPHQRACDLVSRPSSRDRSEGRSSGTVPGGAMHRPQRCSFLRSVQTARASDRACHHPEVLQDSLHRRNSGDGYARQDRRRDVADGCSCHGLRREARGCPAAAAQYLRTSAGQFTPEPAGRPAAR